MKTQAPLTPLPWKDLAAGSLVVLVALALRLMALGRDPLTPSEAHLALEALAWVQGRAWGAVSVPLYPWWTGALFFLTHASDFWARFWPAVLGSLLVLLPWAFFGETRWTYRLSLGLALALDPALVLASRAADGAMWAVPWAVVALALAARGRAVLALLAGLLALSGGPAGWWSLLVLAGTGAVVAASARRQGAFVCPRPPGSLPRRAWKPLAGAAWALLLGFGLYGPGWMAPFQSLMALWAAAKQVPFPWRLALGPFLAYQGPLVLLAWLLIRAGLLQTMPRWARWGLLLAVVAGGLWWLFPGRTPDLAVWVNLGLWPGVVWGLLRLRFATHRKEWAWLLTAFQGMMGVLLFTQGMWWLRDLGLLPVQAFGLRFALLTMAAMLVGLSLITWATVLPWEDVLHHALLAWVGLLLLGQVAGWARVWGPPAGRLWHREVTSPQVRDLQAEWTRWSLWTYGWPGTLKGLSTVTRYPELRWALRDAEVLWAAHPPLEVENPPDAVVTPRPKEARRGAEVFPFRLEKAYRGQDFLLRERIQPVFGPRDAVLWVFHLALPAVEGDHVVFWLREDLFFR